MNFSPKVFQSQFDPKHGYKTVNKTVKKKAVDPQQRTSRERELLHITFQTRSKNDDALPNQASHFQL